MTETQRAYIPTAPPQGHDRIAAHRWKGERGCRVGPFRAKSQAHVFEHYVLHQNGVKTLPAAVVQGDDGWYIDVPG